jgi:hypothetical protein
MPFPESAAPPIDEAPQLRERAARCREIAKEYHPTVGRPLWAKARELDRQASKIERKGVERRGRQLTGDRPALFGRAQGDVRYG